MAPSAAPAQRDLAATATLLGGFLLVGLGVVLASRPDRAGPALLWCLGCTISGFIVGFLFGFPRVVAEDRPTLSPTATAGQAKAEAAAAAAPHQAGGFSHRLAINTNLEQVSDWLTKIIVGVGLVELKDAPAAVTRAGRYFGTGFGGGADAMAFNERLAAAILVFFGSLGVLAGYLLTRMFFSVAFRRADIVTVGAEEARALAQTPLEEEGRKVELPAAAKLASQKLARAPQEAVAGSSEGLAAWARVQFDNGKYEDAIGGYEAAVGLSPRDARLRYSYAIALKYGGRSAADYLLQLEESRRLARSSPDLELRRRIYASYSFNTLYLDPPASFERTREAALEYVENPENLPSGDVLFNLACAYGQQYAYESQLALKTEPQRLNTLRGETLQALTRALAVDPRLIPRAQQLLEGRSLADDDLISFTRDPEFRAAANLPNP